MRAALELIAEKGPGRLHLCRGRALGRRQPGRALSAFPRPRRAAGRRRAPRLRAIRGGAERAWDDGRPDPFDRLRPARQGLSRVRAHRARLLLGDVRGRHSARQPIRNLRDAGDRAFDVLRAATETLVATMPAKQPAAGDDDGAAYLGDVAWHRVAVRPRRCGAAAGCRWRPRNCWRPACSYICAASVCRTRAEAVETAGHSAGLFARALTAT